MTSTSGNGIDKYSIHIFTNSVYELGYSLKIICKPEINIHGAFAVICRLVQINKYLSHPVCIYPVESKQDDTV